MPTDLARVLERRLQHAQRLRDVDQGILFRIAGDDGQSRTANAQAAVRRQTIHVPDTTADWYRQEFPDGFASTQQSDVRVLLATPLLREGEPMSVLSPRRTTQRAFTAAQITLLETFATQAVKRLKMPACSRSYSSGRTS